jgi:DNA primase
MFFITNSAGKSIGWSGRKLYENDTRGKYVNSKDSILFNKSESLYNIASAKKSASELNEMYVCEGQFDVGALIEAGASNVVASSGTAFTEKQAQIIRRLVGENGNIVFCFDADGAGIQAVERIFANIPIIHGQSFVVSMPEGKDPCDYRLENSNQELLELLTAHRKPLVEFILEQSAQKYNLDSHAESAQYVDKASQVLKTISNNTLRSKYIDVVALEAFISVDAVIENVAKASKMDSSGELTVETVPEVPRPELVEGDQLSEKIITMIKQDRVYGTSARLIALTLRDRSLLPELVAIQSKIPPHLDSIVKELEAISPTANLVAENFNLTKIVDSLTTPEYFPFTLDHELNCKLFKSLSLELDKYSHRRREVSARRKISKVLETSPKVSARYLRAALAAEERGLQKG